MRTAGCLADVAVTQPERGAESAPAPALVLFNYPILRLLPSSARRQRKALTEQSNVGVAVAVVMQSGQSDPARGSRLGGMGTAQTDQISTSTPARRDQVRENALDSYSIDRERTATSSREPRPRKKMIACKECRQAKLRCEGMIDGHGPCIRCRRLDFACQVDTSYKRVNKRLKVNDLVEELEQLRSAARETNSYNHLQQRPSQVPQPIPQQQSPKSVTSPIFVRSNRTSPPGDSDYQSNTIATGASPSEPVSGARPPTDSVAESIRIHEPKNIAASCPRLIEHVRLDGLQVNCLFHTFFKHYHSFLEILDPDMTPDVYYERSPLLFWAIIGVASRRYDSDVTLIGNLSSCITRLAWAVVSQLPLSSYTIQALLLLCTWPFPVNTQWKEPSLLWISLAKSAAMQNGLHRPETMQDFMRVRTRLGPDEITQAVKTWAGCYITGESVTTGCGQPSLASSDWAIDSACGVGNPYTLPDNLRYHLTISRFLARINKAMSKHSRSPSGQSATEDIGGIMRLLETDFEDLERQISMKINDAHHIALTIARLQLRTYYFFETAMSERRKQGLLQCYSTALKLILQISDADHKTNFIKYAPRICCQMLVNAGMLVMKIINSSYSRYVDTEGGKRSFNNVLALMRKSSLEDNDLDGRGGKIMAQLWTIHHSRAVRREQEPSISVKSRLGASVFHDNLWTWREEVRGQEASQTGLPQTQPSQPGPADPVINPPQSVASLPSVTFVQPQTPISNQGIATSDNGNQIPQDVVQAYMPNLNENQMGDLATDLSNLDWAWDIGLSSLVPIDLDSYLALEPSFYNNGNIGR